MTEQDHKTSREQALALGWSEEDIALSERMTIALAEAVIGMSAGEGTPMVKVDILHSSIGAILEQSFWLMPNNESRAHYLDHFVSCLIIRISSMMQAFHVPKDATRQ